VRTPSVLRPVTAITKTVAERRVWLVLFLTFAVLIGILSWVRYRSLSLSNDQTSALWDSVEQKLGQEGTKLRIVVFAQKRVLSGHGTPNDVELASEAIKSSSPRIRREGYVLAAFLYRQDVNRTASQALIQRVNEDAEHRDAQSHFLFLGRLPGWQNALKRAASSEDRETSERATLDWQAAASKGLLQ